MKFISLICLKSAPPLLEISSVLCRCASSLALRRRRACVFPHKGNSRVSLYQYTPLYKGYLADLKKEI